MYYFRQARPEDKQPLLRMLKKGNDVPVIWRNRYVINHYLSDVHVVVYQGQLIGMVHLTTYTNGEGWLESAYILPAYRGMGIGTRFASYQISIARMKGVRVLRLATGSHNGRVQHMMGKNQQFINKVPWYRVKVKATSKLRLSSQRKVCFCDIKQISEYWYYIYKNAEFRRSHHLITSLEDPYVWYRLDYATLKCIIMQGRSLASYTNGSISGLILITDKPFSKQASLIVLQVYYDHVEDYTALLSFQLSHRSNLLLSVSSSPLKAIKNFELSQQQLKIATSKWIIMERRL